MTPSVPENSIVNDSTTSGIKKKNVVIIGGSCVAISAALTAKNILPSTHRLIIIEKHSHFHYMFAFPRACVISGWENELFVPYTKLFDSPEKGKVIQALATNITKTHVELDRTVEEFGTSVEYEYLIYATGARHPEPGNFNDHDTKAGAIQRIKETQEKIQKATKILLIGGGAVGLELAAEIREHYPEKEVTLVHSRERYMPLYKPGMHDKTFGILKEFGVRQILGDRANIPEGGFVDDFKMIKVTTKGGKEIECDLQ
ncbi:Apoptosis-inducing factor 2, partial [Haplosporangium sp. Z 27]